MLRMFLRRHVLPLAGFAILVAWWLQPIWGRLSHVIPGSDAGDNLTFVWNLWWMRYAVHHGQAFFWCPLILHPFGGDLTLHTHTAAAAAVAALVPALPLLAAQNLIVAAHLFLNPVCAYALAYRLTRSVGGSMLAGFAFGASPYLSAHLPGHFNLVAAWILPLVVLAAVRAAETNNIPMRVQLGVALGLAAYLDYYYFVYSAILVLALPVAVSCRIGWSARRPWTPAWRAAAGATVAALAVSLALAAAIAITGGFRLRLASLPISVRGVGNPLTVAWLLVIVLAGILATRRVALEVTGGRRALLRSMQALWLPLGIAMVAIAPVLRHAIHLWERGDWVTQTYRWRSSPSGIDALSLFIGNPFSAAYGALVDPMYAHAHIDRVESVGWIGVGWLVLAAVGLAGHRLRYRRYWILVLLAFSLWACGPFLVFAGHQTPLVMPAFLVRFVPIVSNARIPGRAMVVVYLAISMCAASGFVALTSAKRRGRVAAVCLSAIGLVGTWPARPPVFQVPTSSIPAVLRAWPGGGAVCDLPLGVRDGFGATGGFDSMILMRQTEHERPILGGFLARIPPSTIRGYLELPVVGSLIRLSAGGPLSAEHPDTDRIEAAAVLAQLGVRFVVVDRARASADLIRYASLVLPLTKIAEDGNLVAYEVMPPR